VAGHVFVIRGDLTSLACDAWLLPTDVVMEVEEPWRGVLNERTGLPGSWARWAEGERVRRLGAPATGAPVVWIADVGANGAEPRWYVEAALEFVRQAAATTDDVPDDDRVDGRPAVLALPVVGTGEGGAAGVKGDVLELLFTRLLEVLDTENLGVDVVVVCWDAKTYAAAQRARLWVLTDGHPDEPARATAVWPFRDRDRVGALGEAATQLAGEAREGNLAVFMGAGVSAGAGLPGWADLLASLAASLPEDQALTRTTLEGLPDHRDQAVLLERRLAAVGKGLADVLPGALPTERYSLQHGLLSSLPVSEFTTTNFDELFEKAACTDGRELRVLPDGDGGGTRKGLRWLLKLHGTLSDPANIVLTRGSFIEAPRQRGALLGMVQAMLMTRHMLFVGYSLRDEDFHELVHEVRHALPRSPTPEARSSLGTAVTLFPDDLQAEIWAGEVDVLPVLAGQDCPPGPAGREVELLLDLVCLLAADRSRFLLDPDYRGMLTADELALVGQLEQLEVADSGTSDGWSTLRDFLGGFGRDD